VYSDRPAMFSPITRGDVMKSTTRENGLFQWTGWVVGSASLLLLLSVGLELFVQGTLRHSNVATVILGLFLAFWSYLLGLGLLVVLSVWCLMRVRRVRVTRAAISRYPPAESRNRGLEKPEQEAHQDLEHWVAGGIPIRSTRAGDTENETNSLTRVA
jgi:hypothetical protein